MKKVIYTCITGEYDSIKEPRKITEGWDYICFTNNPKLTSENWKIVLLEDDLGLDNTRLARRVKLLPHAYVGEYDLSIWCDANLTVGCNLDSFVKQVLPEGFKLTLMTHGHRNCIYAEGAECIAQKKDDPNVINKQLEKFRSEGYPEDKGMVQTGIQVRLHNDPELIAFNEAWFDIVRSGSKRDQLAFNYVVWKNKAPKWGMFSHMILFNPAYFQIQQHNHGW